MPATEDQKAAGRAAIDEFLKEVEQILTLYYDGWRAFGLLAAEYEQTAQKIKASTRISDEELAKLTHKYVYQLASDLPEHEVAERTHHEYWEDNQHNGRNLRRLGNLCLVQIYALWERECRPTIKVHLGVLPNSDVMGDVRLLRISILHHHGVATDDVARCTELTWFKPGDPILITFDQFRLFWQAIREDMARLRATIA